LSGAKTKTPVKILDINFFFFFLNIQLPYRTRQVLDCVWIKIINGSILVYFRLRKTAKNVLVLTRFVVCFFQWSLNIVFNNSPIFSLVPVFRWCLLCAAKLLLYQRSFWNFQYFESSNKLLEKWVKLKNVRQTNFQQNSNFFFYSLY